MHVRRAFPAVCIMIALGALVASVACLLNPHNYYLYLLDIFSFPLLTMIIGTAIAFVTVRQKPAVMITVVAIAILGAALWPQTFAAQRPTDMSKPPVRLMFANVFIRNPTPQKILPWITEEKPDIIAIVERNPNTAEFLSAALKTSHPYQYEPSKYSETAIYSRFPIEKILKLSAPGNCLAARVSTPNGPLTILITHLGHPGHGRNWIQNFQLSLLQEVLALPEKRTTVLVGDFNTDMSGYLLADFARKFNLRPLAVRIGTWPSALPGVLRIGIDNAFAGENLSLSGRKVGPYNGSDHRPIIMDIRPVKPIKPPRA